GIDLDRRIAVFASDDKIAEGTRCLHQGLRLQVMIVGPQVARPLELGQLEILGLKPRRDTGHDVPGDLVLHGKDIFELAIVTLGPDLMPLLGIDQLSGYADAVAGAPDASLGDIAYAELAADPSHIDRRSLEREGCIAGDHE